ncbi:hypothetical protein B0A49_02117 [Cryomyces minteri]|uniref:Uncharacterized protein n=1 Tax=Cryomyces minteri TaxID=331657 RepID=A0A4U0XPF8_9PEZI|nr:hypothetical protein B0A49_02117 [Cryomyces minteri]
MEQDFRDSCHSRKSRRAAVGPFTPSRANRSNCYSGKFCAYSIDKHYDNPIYNHTFKLAIERHLNALPEAERKAFLQASESLTEENLLISVRAYDAEHKQRLRFRPHTEALSIFLVILNNFVAGVAIGIQANPATSSIVAGAVRVVIDLAVGFVEFFGKLSEMLCRFAIHGKLLVIEALLQKGADANSHESVVEDFLEKGMDINPESKQHGSVLHAASELGYDRIVEQLLKNGANVNAKSGKYGKNGVDVNIQGGVYGNALQAASAEGHEGTVRLLLDNGADVNAQGGQYGNALPAAAWEFYYDGGRDEKDQERARTNMVQLLLGKGADINIQVRLLLDNGADVNAQGGEYGDALQAAARCYHNTTEETATSIVQLLLNKGPNVSAQGGSCGSALRAAKGHKKILQLLIENGAVSGEPEDPLTAKARETMHCYRR